jgi:hypothetical protein
MLQLCWIQQGDVSLDAKAQLSVVVVCAKYHANFGNVDLELDLACLPLEHLRVVLNTLKEKLFAKLPKCGELLKK